MEEEDWIMEQGKIYFISYGSNTQLVIRFKDENSVQYNYYDGLHYWNGSETFHRRAQINYCVKSNIVELRAATKPEKHALLRFELEYDCI